MRNLDEDNENELERVVKELQAKLGISDAEAEKMAADQAQNNELLDEILGGLTDQYGVFVKTRKPEEIIKLTNMINVVVEQGDKRLIALLLAMGVASIYELNRKNA